MDASANHRELANEVARATVERMNERIPTMDAIEKKIDIAVAGAVSRAAAEAAEIAVTKTLVSFGLDPKNQLEIMRNFIFLDDARKLSSGAKKSALVAIMGTLVTFAVAAAVAYVKMSVK